LIAVPTFRLESEARLTEAGGDDLYPAMLQSLAGIWLVWSSDRNGDPDLFYKVSYDFGGNWCQDYVLASDVGVDTDPAILQDRDGKIWVAWQSDRDGDWEIYYKTRTGWSWSGDMLLTQHPLTDEGPSIAQTSDGLIWILWSSDRKDGNSEIYYMTFDGTSWSAVRRLTTNPARDSKPAAVSLSDGSLWVFWSTDRDGASDIYYKIYDGVAWSGEMKLACSAGDKECPSAASTSNDEVWVSYTRAGDVFYMRYYDGGWSGESLVLTPAHDNRHACIIQAANGIIWMAYSSSRGGDGEVYAQLSNFRIDSGVDPDGGGGSGQPGFTLLGITPNPASGRTTLKFAMPEAHSFDLAVYDIRGRRVKAVAGGFADAGIHEVVWDGADAWGHPVTPGIYFCTLKVGEHASGRKLVVAR
jgi:hypothetical protein